MIKNMQPGSVIYDLAASQGGNAAFTKADEIVNKDGVIIEGESVITSNSINGGESEYNSKISSPNKFLLIRP